jgi:hypothetical protein
MKKVTILTLVMLTGVIGLFGCARPTEEVISNEEIISSTATVQANIDALPTDVPIHENAINLKFAAGNTYITYEVPGDVDTIAEYYRTELAALGWEKKGNSPEQPIGGAITILRTKPDKNISVTVQSIPESENVRVLITVIKK